MHEIVLEKVAFVFNFCIELFEGVATSHGIYGSIDHNSTVSHLNRTVYVHMLMVAYFDNN